MVKLLLQHTEREFRCFLLGTATSTSFLNLEQFLQHNI